MIPLKVGDNVPKFSLPDQDGEIINLSICFDKQILIYFYPKAMTTGCTIQVCRLRDEMHKLKQINVEAFGISTGKKEKFLCFTKKEMLNFTLLLDYKQEVAEKFDIWW